MESPKTHVLFDFFGTLVTYSESRTEQGYERSHRLLADAGSDLSYEQFLRIWDATAEAYETSARGTLDEYSMDEVCRVFLQKSLRRLPEAALVGRFRDQYLDDWDQGVQYLPEVPRLLEELSQRFVLVLVTNTHHAELVHRHLERMAVRRHFSAIVTSVEHGKRKPDQAIFAHALELVGGTPAGSVFIGDSHEADYRGATSAGMDCLLIDPGQRHDIPPAARIAHVTDVRRLLFDMAPMTASREAVTD